MSKYLLFLSGVLAFGGRSIQLSTATAGNTSIPAQTPGKPWRVEFSIHDWDPNASVSHPIVATAVGFDVTLYNLGGGVLYLYIVSTTAAGSSSACGVNGLGPNGPSGGGTLYANKFVTVRFQEDPVAKIDYCQAWDIFGNLVTNTNASYTSNTGINTKGAFVGGTGQNLSTAYFRIYTSIVSPNARPPLTADTMSNCLVFWKFDLGNDTGSLNDSCAAGPYNAKMSAGAPVYVPTPGQSLVVPTIKTMNSPGWTLSTTLRAGFPAQLDGSTSYSQADAGASTTCFWQTLSGPTRLIWDDHASCTPTIQGLIFGDYQFELVATATSGARATLIRDLGAVATDSNGVVIQADPNADIIFGPMIALGRNPWGWQDERAFTANSLQGPVTGTAIVTKGSGAVTTASGNFLPLTTIVIGSQTYKFTRISANAGSILPIWSGPGGTVNWTQANNFLEQAPGTWATPGAGTVSYPLRGIGPSGLAGTTLSGAILATDTVISIADASKIPGLAALPTWILIGNSLYGGQEVVRITGTTATSGPATLTVGYDGRGVSAGLWSNINPPNVAWGPAAAHPAGAIVGEFKIAGAGTLFHSDPNSALCPVGIPGPMGQAYYSAGTVTLARNSATITGSGTLWQTIMGAGAASDYYVMFIQATHGGGIPFNWWAQLVSVGSETSTTWSRPLPADVDAGPFSYVILKQNAPALQFSDSNGGYNGIFESAGCESETQAFGGAYFELFYFSGAALQTGQHWSYESDSTNERGIAGAFGPNFYGTGLAQRALYLRSGLTSALNNANLVDDYWIRNPRLCGGFGCSGSPLLTGGGLIGAVADLVLNPDTKLTWQDVRQWAINGSIGAMGCNAFDTRDSGYLEAAPILAALFDGNPTYQAVWSSAVQAINTRDNNCRSQGITAYPAETNSWANSFLWNNSAAPITLVNGSTNGTGTGIGAGFCDGIETGTASVMAGSSSVTATSGTFSTRSTTIVLQGRYFQFTRLTATMGTISALWPGSSGAVSFMTRSTDLSTLATALITFGLNATDAANLQYNFACIRNSSSQITLDRPWPGGNGIYYPYQSNLAGYGQQPYMLGIKTLNMNWGAHLDSALSTNFGANAVLAGEWEATYGLDYANGDTTMGTQGMSYGRVFGFAESGGTQHGAFTWKNPATTFGLEAPDSYTVARELNQESFSGFVAKYTANPTIANRKLGDVAYGAIWCEAALTLDGVYCDSHSVGENQGSSNLTDPYMSAFKWTGYFFGVGMSHQWPAVRLGGVQPSRPRRVLIALDLGDIPAASRYNVVVTAPSGAQTTFPCSSHSCAVTVDDRQGTHWYRIQYFSSNGALLSESKPDLLQ